MAEPQTSNDSAPDEATIVVNRDLHSSLLSGPDEGTIILNRAIPEATDLENDGTIVLNRADLELSDLNDEGTIVLKRANFEPTAGGDDEGTIVLNRTIDFSDHDGTIVLKRAALSDSERATIVVPRSNAPVSGGTKAAVTRRSRRHNALSEPPSSAAGPISVVVAAVLASGSGAISSYQARPIPKPPAVIVGSIVGGESTRAPAPSMQSVSRGSRRFGILALVVVAAVTIACAAGLYAVISLWIAL